MFNQTVLSVMICASLAQASQDEPIRAKAGGAGCEWLVNEQIEKLDRAVQQAHENCSVSDSIHHQSSRKISQKQLLRAALGGAGSQQLVEKSPEKLNRALQRAHRHEKRHAIGKQNHSYNGTGR